MSLTYLQFIKLIISIIIDLVMQEFLELSFIEQIVIVIVAFLFFSLLEYLGAFHSLERKIKKLISPKQKTETINEENINFSSITPYCEIKHGIPSIGVIIEIINSSTEMIYCSGNSEVTFLKINDRTNQQKFISSNIKVLPYSCPKICLKNQIQDIEVYQKPFTLEFHIQLNFYKNQELILFSKDLHYEAECIFVQDAIERNRLHLEIMLIKCNKIPEIEFTTVSKS